MKFRHFLLVSLGLIAGSVPLFADYTENGAVEFSAGPQLLAPVAVTVGATWFSTTTVPPAFFWAEDGLVTDSFVFSHPEVVAVYVTDDFQKGDQFEVFDNGVSLGVTYPVAVAAGLEIGPDAAFADPDYSSGCFNLPPGEHSISLEVIENPYANGRGYIQILEGVCPDTVFKHVVSGNDVDTDGEIDKVVEVGIESASMYDFAISWNNADGLPVVIEDTVPAEWDVMAFGGETQNFDFEDETATPLGTLSLVSLGMSKGSQSVLLYRDSGAGFDIVDWAGFYPANWGNQALSPFKVFPGDAFILDLTEPVETFCIDFGDFGQDGDTPVDIWAYDDLGGTGTLVDSDTDTWDDSDAFPSFKTNCVSADGEGNIQSIKFTSAGPFVNSLYWDNMTMSFDSLNCEIASANKKDNGKSATKITCYPETGSGQATFWAEARCHGNRRNQKCKPTSCGALYLNDGAAVYLLDELGEPVYPPIAESNSLCLAAVEDLDGGGLEYDGTGDEDADGVLDYEEACGIGTDPCNDDSDGDGYIDGEDSCPLRGSEGHGVDDTGCPIVQCNAEGTGSSTYSLLLEGDGTIATGSAFGIALWDPEGGSLGGSFNPDGGVDMRATNLGPDGCSIESDWVDFLGSCAVGSCTGTFTNGCGVTPLASGAWFANIVGQCELSNPDAAPAPASVRPVSESGDAVMGRVN